MIIEFPEWLPDLPDLNNPGATVANNVLPSGDSYKNMSDFVPDNTISSSSTTIALTNYPRGSIFVRDVSTGQAINFVGDETKLYFGDSNGWTDVSKAGGYALGTDELWFFTQFDDDVIAATIDAPLQIYDLDASAQFADLVSTIQARYIATVKDFVMIANTFDGVDGPRPNRVRWCALGDPTSWTISAATQADIQDLDAQYGWITGLVGGDYAVVFQERSITRLDYVGSPTIFQVNTVEQNQGTIYPKSIVRVGTLIYYIGIDGFYVFDGTRSVSIGANKIDNWFFDNFDQGFPHRISTAVDYQKQLIQWAFPVGGNVGGTPNKLLIYNYSPNSTKRWTTADMTLSFLMNAYSYGYNLDNIDGTPPGYFVTNGIDSVGAPSFDSNVFTGQNLLIAGFNDLFQFGTFNGSTLTGTITTAEFELNDGARTELQRFKPIIEGTVTTTTCRVGYRELTTDTVTYTPSISVNSLYEVICRINSRYFRIEVTIAGGTWDAIGVQPLEMKKVGIR